MRQTLRSLLAAVVALGLASCTDAPSAPATSSAARWPAAGESLLGVDLGLATALTRTSALPADVVVKVRVDAAGGAFSVPGTGLRVVVPAGAVPGPTDITATALAGRAVAYEFEPHGITFAQPLQFTQELRGTNWLGLPLLDFRAVYFADRSQVDASKALIGIDEVLPLSVDVLRQQVRFDVRHFSGYGVSTGRAR